MIEVVTAVSLWELVKHASTWVVNLKRAKDERKRDSIDALRMVIVAAQQTKVYIRQLNDTCKQSHSSESELSTQWTKLSFSLEDLGMTKLAERCRAIGKRWADPTKFDEEQLSKSDDVLERMEVSANEILQQVGGRQSR